MTCTALLNAVDWAQQPATTKGTTMIGCLAGPMVTISKRSPVWNIAMAWRCSAAMIWRRVPAPS